MSQLRLAFIGCGNHATGSLQPCIPLIPQLDFVATCDLVAEKAQRSARRFGAKSWYTDYRKMLEKENPEAVAIVGPPIIHTQIGIDCLQRGLHIFIEKPPATSLKDAIRLCETSAKSGKFGMVGTMWRHAPAHKMVKDIISNEKFGNPILFEGRYIAPSPTGSLETAEWAYLLDQGVHPTDCMRFLMEDVATVRSVIRGGNNGRLSFAVSLQFVNGAVGTLNLMGGSCQLESSIFVAGDGGQSVQVRNFTQLEYLNSDPWLGGGGYRDFPSQCWSQGTHYRGHSRHGYVEELEHFALSILTGQQPHASLEDAYQMMRIIQAIRDSNKSGAVIKLI